MTTRRALIQSTAITLLSVTAGCMGGSDDKGDSLESTETVEPLPRNETRQPPLTNATPRRPTPETTATARTSTQETTRPTPPPSATPTATPSTARTSRPQPTTSTQPTTTTQPQPTTTQPTTQTRSHAQEHPYLSVGSGTAKFGLDRSRYPVMGSDRAPVEILYWSDYLCEYCSQFATSTHPQLISREVQRGHTRFVFLELPNIGKNSRPAAMLSKAVWETVAATDPALFWQWHQTVFERQRTAGSGWADAQNLLKIATEVGIDANAVKTARDTYRDAFALDINAAIDAADRASIPGTPAFHVYNRTSDQSKTIIGTQPLSVYRSAIKTVK